MDLSIVIINWKSAAFTLACVRSIRKFTEGIQYEVIVVDNASYDGCDRLLSTEFPEVRYIQSKDNLGFSRANNLGASQSSGDFILFLNPDTEIFDGALPAMIESLRSLPDGGLLGCKILNPDRTVQTTCIQSFPTILNQSLDAQALRTRFPKSSLWGMRALFDGSAEPTPVEMVSGACMLLKRKVYEEVQGFSEDYFMYAEDADLCYKVWQRGWKVYYLPTAHIIHYGGQSSKQTTENSFATLLRHVSLDTYFRKIHGKAYAVAFRISRTLDAILRLGLLAVMSIAPVDDDGRLMRRATLQKWKTILRWSVGLEKWAG
jgi:GT2 family glycosyltransferase